VLYYLDGVLARRSVEPYKKLYTINSITCQDRGLNVIIVSSVEDYVNYEKEHENDTILLVRSPIPNEAEASIMEYIQSAVL
jgi:hypothetical protein